MMHTLAKPLLWLFLVLSSLFSSPSCFAETTASTAKVTGGIEHEMPAWFKESFLSIQEDVEEAKQAKKHIMLFFHLNNCPYCAKMLDDSFLKEPLQSYIQTNFDVIAINVRGDRQVEYNKELSLSEKELAQELGIQYTPTMVFLNTDNKTVARLNGYRSPEQFKPVLDYVSQAAYKTQSLTDYLAKQAPGSYQLRANALFQDLKDFSTIKTPLAVIFEDSHCQDCDFLHDDLLTNETVKSELKPFTLVRLDAESEQSIIDTTGKSTTPKEWAQALKLTYRPGIILFDEGQEVTRLEAKLFKFHFKELFNYVSSKAYKEKTYPQHLGQRQDEFIKQGVTINLSE